MSRLGLGSHVLTAIARFLALASRLDLSGSPSHLTKPLSSSKPALTSQSSQTKISKNLLSANYSIL